MWHDITYYQRYYFVWQCLVINYHHLLQSLYENVDSHLYRQVEVTTMKSQYKNYELAMLSQALPSKTHKHLKLCKPICTIPLNFYVWFYSQPFTPLSCKYQSQANSRMHFAINEFFCQKMMCLKGVEEVLSSFLFLPRFLEMCILITVKSYASSCLSSTSFTFFLQIFFPFLCHIWVRRLS